MRKYNYDLIKNFTSVNSNNERLTKMFFSAVKGIQDPDDGTHISELGDLSSMNSLRWIKWKMEQNEEGRRILKEQPRITEQTVDFINLKNYDTNSLGYHYWRYMSEIILLQMKDL